MTHKLNRLLALMLAVIMAFSMLLVPAEAASGFRDVPENAWYKAAVDYVSEKGWMAGVSENSFAPNKEVTRGMMVTVLARLAEAETDNDTAAFADTAAGKWYTGAAAWAAENGIVAGVGNGRFSPNRNISRQDLCVMLKGYIDAMGIELKNDIDRTFSDMESVAGYAREAVIYCTGVGLVSGFEDRSFRPKDTATRAQLAQILMRLDLLLKGEEAPADPMPAQSFNGEAGEDMTVSVNAPEGALPENTNMTVSRVTDVDDLTSIQSNFEGNVLAAADITFSKNGTELEPEADVEVQISLDGLESIQNPAVYHIKGDGTVERISAELVSLNRGGCKVLRFFSKDFSVYVIVDEDDGNSGTDRGTVNFYGITSKINNASPELEFTTAPRASYIIKNDDEYLAPDVPYDNTVSYINDIVSDPGVGVEITSNTLFRGWCITDDPSTITLETEALSIEGIWEELGKLTKANSLDNETVINIYPVVIKYFNITYYGSDTTVSLGTKTETLLVNDQSTVHKVNMSYTPASNQDFKGWKSTTETDGNILNVVIPSEEEDGEPTLAAKPTDSVYANDTQILIKGHVVFNLEAPEGVWLVYNTNGKGGTYNAPQFYLKDSEITPHETAAASEMTRKGYQFKGWYAIKEGQTPTADADGNYTIVDNDPYFEPFSFTNADGTKKTISEDTYIYARWDANTTAQYTVLFWRQNVNGWETKTDGTYDKTKPIYDFLKENEEGTVVYTITGTADVGATITAALNGNNVRVSVDNTTLPDQNIDKAIPTGCHFEKADPAAGITVSLTENNVLNVYFDRNEYTFKFYTSTPNTETKTKSGYQILRTGNNNNRQFAIQIEGKWYQITSNSNININNYFWDDNYQFLTSGNYNSSFTPAGTIYTAYNGNTNYTVRTFNISSTEYNLVEQGLIFSVTKLYEQNISDIWPIVGTNGTTYDQGQRWMPQNSTTYDDVMIYIEIMPAESVSFVLDTRDYQQIRMKYYVEGLNEGDPDVLYTTVYGQLGYVQKDLDWMPLNGYTKTSSDPAFGSSASSKLCGDAHPNGNDGNLPEEEDGDHGMVYYIDFYYKRNIYQINYMDGIYVNGNGQTITTETNQGQLNTADGLVYGADLTQYNQTVKNGEGEDVPGTKFYDPTAKMLQMDSNFGYEFAGWYIDSSCTTKYTFTTMPVGGVTVYAKWQLKQYRAYLHPNVPVPASTSGSYDPKTYVSWGDETKPADDKQQFNFRIDFGKKISLPTGVVRGYEFVGWFTDPEFKNVYTPSTEFNDKTITTAYDQKDPTDLMDKFGQVIPYGWQEGDDDPYGVKGHVYISNEDRGAPESAAATNFNSDAQKNRTWITKRLDLYAQWRVAVIGAPGINIRYSAIDTTGEVDDNGNVGTIVGHFADGTDTVMMDPQYYVDTASAVSLSASVPPADSNYLFDCWVVQTWDATAKDFVDLKDDNDNLVTVYPGSGFGVDAKTAKIVLVGSDPEQVVALADVVDSPDVHYTYTIQLRAEYKEKYSEKDTHVYWYANNGTDDKQENNGLKINQPIDIPTTTTWVNGDANQDKDGASATAAGLEFAGHTFLGWARLENHKAADGTEYWTREGQTEAVDLTTLNESDLFLKWDDENEQFLAQDGEGSWTVEATQVACDEKHPYHDLFAVWSRDLFYVFHSSTGVMQAFKVPITQVESNGVTKFEVLPFDITALVPTGYVYGGYYKTYGGVSQSAVDAAVSAYTGNAAEAGWSLSNVSDTYTFNPGTDFEAYDGSKSTSTVTNSKFWIRNNAYQVTDTMTAQESAAVNGETMLPTNGTVYYLKEVPNTYLANKFFYVYDNLNNAVNEDGSVVTGDDGNPVKVQTLEDLYFISVIDDASYKTIGYKIADGVNSTEDGNDMMAEVLKEDITKRTTLARSVKFIQKNGGPVDPETGKPTDLTTIIKPKKADGDGNNVYEFGISGYLEIVQINKQQFKANDKFTVRPTWETLDGVAVSGKTALGVTIGANGKITDEGFGSTLYDYQRIYIDLSNAKFKFQNSDITGNTWFTDENWYGNSNAKTVIQFRDVESNKYTYKALEVDSNTKIGSVDVPEGYKEMILVLCGVNSAVGEAIWNDKWAQTVAFAIHTNKNYISSFYGYAGNVAVPPTDNNTVWSHYETD